MADIIVYQAGFIKPGPPIFEAWFEELRVYNDGSYQFERTEPAEMRQNVYHGVFISNDANGKLRVNAPGYKSKELPISNGGRYDVWLDKE